MDYQPYVNELVSLLKQDDIRKIRHQCIQEILGLTGTKESLALLLKQHDLVTILTSNMVNQGEISKFSCLALINMSADEYGAKKILHINCDDCKNEKEIPDKAEIISNCLTNILNKECDIADSCCMLLCNISRSNLLANYVLDNIVDCKNTINKIIDAFCDLKYNTVGCTLDYLGPFFSNISQTTSAVEYLCESAERLVPFIEYLKSVIRRGGITGMLRNFSLNKEKRSWMLSKEGLNVLPRILLPLADSTEFLDDEMEKLPIELQYLPETKEVDPDPDIRRMLLELLLMLCSSKEEREILRENNAYIILRELHKKENDFEVLLACEKVVDILIRTEEEIGIDRLDELDVPHDLLEKFDEMDKDFLKNN